MYQDALNSIEMWTDPQAKQPRKVAIYSSGSVFAQKLLFEHIQDPSKPDDRTAVLDYRPKVTVWFDTTNAGPKLEATSYTKVASELQLAPAQILFLSDNVGEVRASLEAGMRATVVIRPGNAELSGTDNADFDNINTFDELDLKN
jgi:enolase-phosphatase E1